MGLREDTASGPRCSKAELPSAAKWVLRHPPAGPRPPSLARSCLGAPAELGKRSAAHGVRTWPVRPRATHGCGESWPRASPPCAGGPSSPSWPGGSHAGAQRRPERNPLGPLKRGSWLGPPGSEDNTAPTCGPRTTRIFKTLPSGGLLDPTCYREILPQHALLRCHTVGRFSPRWRSPPSWTSRKRQSAGWNRQSATYASGLHVAVYRLGAGPSTSVPGPCATTSARRGPRSLAEHVDLRRPERYQPLCGKRCPGHFVCASPGHRL